MPVFEKPEGPQEGDSQIRSSDIQAMIQQMLRQVQGDGKTISVDWFGDRIIISSKSPQGYPPISQYLQRFVIVAEYEDYLACTQFVHPNDGVKIIPQEYDSTLGEDAANIVYVAKPYTLQQTPWDGQTVDLYGSEVRYEYTDIGQRDAIPIEDEEDGEAVPEQITPAYMTGEVILARTVPTGYVTPHNGPIMFQDANEAGRVFAAPSSVTGSKPYLAQITATSSAGYQTSYQADIYGDTWESTQGPTEDFPDFPAHSNIAVLQVSGTQSPYFNGELVVVRFLNGNWTIQKLYGSPLEDVFEDGQVLWRASQLGSNDISQLNYIPSAGSASFLIDTGIEWNDMRDRFNSDLSILKYNAVGFVNGVCTSTQFYRSASLPFLSPSPTLMSTPTYFADTLFNGSGVSLLVASGSTSPLLTLLGRPNIDFHASASNGTSSSSTPVPQYSLSSSNSMTIDLGGSVVSGGSITPSGSGTITGTATATSIIAPGGIATASMSGPSSSVINNGLVCSTLLASQVTSNAINSSVVLQNKVIYIRITTSVTMVLTIPITYFSQRQETSTFDPTTWNTPINGGPFFANISNSLGGSITVDINTDYSYSGGDSTPGLADLVSGVMIASGAVIGGFCVIVQAAPSSVGSITYPNTPVSRSITISG